MSATPGNARRWQVLTVIALAAAWEFAGRSGLVYAGVVPPLAAIAAALVALVSDPRFWTNLALTGFEIAAALLVGGSLGVAIGAALGRVRLLGAAYGPILSTLAATPKVAVLPLLYLAFGVGPASKVAVGSLAALLPMALATAAGVGGVAPALDRLGRNLSLSPWQMLRLIYLPAALPTLFGGLRIALGAAIAICLIAEIRFSSGGLGAMLIDSFNRSRFSNVYALIVVIFALAIAGNAGLAAVGRRR
ncbi:MAG: ABC transporter permease subunit [Bauldia sp.]